MAMYVIPTCVLCEQRKTEGSKSVRTEKFVCDDCVRLCNAVAARQNIITVLEHLQRVRV